MAKSLLKKNSVCLIGNNLATIVAAFELGRSGIDVKLFSDSGRLGGFFSGLCVDGYDFDLGCILIEKFNSNKTDFGRRSTINSWLSNEKIVSTWLEKHNSLKRVRTPKVYIDGYYQPDYIMSNRLDMFKNSKIKTPEYLELDHEAHAFNKETSILYNHLSYEDASMYNHGNDFHDSFIEPFINKVTSKSSSDFLARYHRFAWSPLYYPETLKSVINGECNKLKEYIFWTTSSGFVGSLPRNILQNISRMSNVELIEKRLSSISFKDDKLVLDNDIFEIDEKVMLGLGAERVLELLNCDDLKPTRGLGVNFTIGFALVHKDHIDFSINTSFIVDKRYASFRITNQDALAKLNPDWHRISLEANSDILKRHYPDQNINEALKKDLMKLLNIKNIKDVKILKVLNVANGLILPTKTFVRDKDQISEEILRVTKDNVYLSGDLLGFGSSSINNQVMQGLKYSEEVL